jgi:hypothetical protein
MMMFNIRMLWTLSNIQYYKKYSVSETFQFIGVVYTKFVEEMKHIFYFSILFV